MSLASIVAPLHPVVLLEPLPFQRIQLCLGRTAPVDVRTTRVTRGPYTDG